MLYLEKNIENYKLHFVYMLCPCYWYVQYLQQEFCAGWVEI